MNVVIHSLSYIRSHYGQDCLQVVRSLKKMSVKVADYRNHLQFNLQRLHEHLTPYSLKLRSSIPGYRAKKILKNVKRKVLNERVWQVNCKIDQLKCNQDELKTHLSDLLSSDSLLRVMEFVQNTQLSRHRQENRQLK